MEQLLNDYIDLWKLSQPELLAQTATSHVYKVQYNDEVAVLKLLTPIGVHDEASGGVALRHYNGYGAVQLYQGDNQAHLLEYVGGADLVPMVQQGNDAQATEIIAEVLNKLHREKGQATGLWTLRQRFLALFKKAEADKLAGSDSIYQRAAVVAGQLLSNPIDECVLHGDMHHENIRYHDQRGWIAFDPKGVFGERTYDTANTFLNPVDMTDRVQNETRILSSIQTFSKALDIDPLRIASFAYAHACLSASWSIEDGYDAQQALNFAQIIEAHVR